MPTASGSGLTSSGRRRGASGRALRVAVIDDQHLTRLGLRAILERDDRFVVVFDGCCTRDCGVDLVAHDIQVAVVASEQNATQTVTMIECIHETLPETAIVALGQDELPERIIKAFGEGAAAYLPRSATAEELANAMTAAAAGRNYLRTNAASTLAMHLRRDRGTVVSAAPSSESLLRLSARERVVMLLIARGFSGPQIGAQLGIATKTVDTYRHRIREKTGLHDRSEFVRATLSAGLLT
jgi:DNA-binding NarL/FixJ family response regulator